MADSINGAVKDALGVAAPETSVAAPETSSEMQAHRLRDDADELVVGGLPLSTLVFITGLFLFALGVATGPFCAPLISLIGVGLLLVVTGVVMKDMARDRARARDRDRDRGNLA